MRAGRFHTMRGAPIRSVVAGILAVALLSACTAKASTTSPLAVPAALTSSAPASPVVTVPPVTEPLQSSAPVSPLTSDPTSTLTPTATVKPTPPKIIPAATYSSSPRLGSTDLVPRTTIVVRSANGTLSGVALTNSGGTAVKGTLSPDKRSWTLAEPLGYDTTYTLTGKAVGVTGKAVALKGSYRTVDPDGVIGASISPDGDTVGIGAPILISIGTDIKDTVGRQNIEKAITVTTVPKTEGSFAWIQHWNGWGLDWRPKSYWVPGTKVTVKANLYGVSYGDNLWGKEDIAASFNIGRSEITKGDINTHRLKVYRNGKLLFDFPTSYGLDSDPGRVTHGGTYIVMSKEYLHLMSNPAYHYFNFKAYYAVRISNNGTFIHANDGTDDVQGYENVTHGCANLSMTNAQAFYDQTMYGDPVEITNSSIPMSQSDGDIYDWSIPWSKWQTLSALSKAYAG